MINPAFVGVFQNVIECLGARFLGQAVQPIAASNLGVVKRCPSILACLKKNGISSFGIDHVTPAPNQAAWAWHQAAFAATNYPIKIMQPPGFMQLFWFIQ
jgi:hypothetical protein